MPTRSAAAASSSSSSSKQPPPTIVTQADRRGKRVISSPVEDSEEDAEGEDVEDDLESEDGVESEDDLGVGPSRGDSENNMDIDEELEESENEDQDEDEDAEGEYIDDELIDDDPESYVPQTAPITSKRISISPSKAVSPTKGNHESTRTSTNNGSNRISTNNENSRISRESGGSASGLKLKLNLGSASPSLNGNNNGKIGGGGGGGENIGKRPARAAAKKAGKRAKQVAMDAALADAQSLGSDEDGLFDDEDELAPSEFSSRAASPSKMTARQRAKGNKDLQETLIALPEAQSKTPILTEAERLERREEMARRRKRQTDQKKQDEQDQTINRLLRAQTGRSRNKIEAPTGSPGPDTTITAVDIEADSTNQPFGNSRRLRASYNPPKEGMIRWVSTISKDGTFSCKVGVPEELGDVIDFDNHLSVGKEAGKSKEGKKDDKARCGVEGCANGRKYRSVKRFEIGGCSMEHLKLVEAGI